MQSTGFANSHLRYTLILFLFTLALSFLAHVQIDNEFKSVNKVFSIKKLENPGFSFPLEKAEFFQIQVAHRIEGKEPITADLSLFINNKKVKELQIRGTETKKVKFTASQFFFKKGENQITWKLTSSRSGVVVDEIKLTNYVGINPNFPVAWVVPDAFISSSFTQDKERYQFITVLFWVSLAVILYIALCRLIFYNTLQSCLSACCKFFIIPTLALCATLLYSVFTPQTLLFPTETTLWLIGVSLLAAQIPSIFIVGALDKSIPIKETCVTLTIICLISILAYLPYFKNAWYVQDDYLSIYASVNPNYSSNNVILANFGKDGIFSPILESTKNIVNWLYGEQGRYQPVRLFLFIAFAHLFQEEYSPYYNFALHLANLIILFLLLRKFKAEPVACLISVLLFSLFGRWRMMESPSTMIAGSGLNFFLISLTLLFLIKALETNNFTTKKIFYLSVSWFAYFCLVFSYEVAFPLILPVIYIFFNFRKKFEWRESLYLTPYFIWLSVYILFFKLPAKGTYPGTTISWNIADIWARLMNYAGHTISLRINLKHISTVEVTILFLYFVAAVLAVRSGKPSLTALEQRTNNWKTLLFGLIFYFSSMILFTLNSWESPNNIMIHHIYLMSAGASILTVLMFFQAQWFLPGFTFATKSNPEKVLSANIVQKYFRNSLIFIFFPLVLVSEGNYLSRHYAGHDVGPAFIKPIKSGVRKHIDPNKTDAIIIKNFHYNYHGMSSVEGAFMHWFNIKRIIHAGRPILSADNDKIVFMGQLGNYWRFPTLQYETKNNRTQILFLEGQSLLPYDDFILFEEGSDLYQTQQVWGDQEPDEFRHYRLDAILKNENHGEFLAIKTHSEKDLESLIANTTRIEVNSKPISRILTSGGSLFIDIGSAKNTVNYFFLTLVSTDKNFKKHLQLIRLQNPDEGTVHREIEYIPVGADSWGIE